MKTALILVLSVIGFNAAQAQTLQSAYLFRAKEQSKGFHVKKFTCAQNQALDVCTHNAMIASHVHYDGFDDDIHSKIFSYSPSRGSAEKFNKTLVAYRFNSEFIRLANLDAIQAAAFSGQVYCPIDQDHWIEPEQFHGVALLDKKTRELLLVY